MPSVVPGFFAKALGFLVKDVRHIGFRENDRLKTEGRNVSSGTKNQSPRRKPNDEEEENAGKDREQLGFVSVSLSSQIGGRKRTENVPRISISNPPHSRT